MKCKRIILLLLLPILLLISIPFINLNKDDIEGWPPNRSRIIADYILPNENTNLIQPPLLCRGPEKIFLLIVVCSSVNHFEARQSIRESWGNTTEFNYPMFEKFHGSHKGSFLNINSKQWRKYVENPSANQKLNASNFRVRVAFLLGVNSEFSEDQQSKIDNEHKRHGDIIQENFIDSYNNLTLKTIMMLKWATSNCVNKVKFIMKFDDDMFLNVPNLIHVLLGGTIPVYEATFTYFDNTSINTRNEMNRLMEDDFDLIGYKFCQKVPAKDVRSKWYMPDYMYSEAVYPDYVAGMAYVMNFEAAQQLYEESFSTPLIHLEDIYLTGLVTNKTNLIRQNHPLFTYAANNDHCSLRGVVTQSPLVSIKLSYTFVKNLQIECPLAGGNFIPRKMRKEPNEKHVISTCPRL